MFKFKEFIKGDFVQLINIGEINGINVKLEDILLSNIELEKLGGIIINHWKKNIMGS